MDRLLEKVRELLNRILEWWNRFTAKQKTLIVSGVAVIILAVVFIVTRMTQPQYILLRECESTAESAEIRDLLDEEGLHYTISDDGLVIRILKGEVSDAQLLLGANNIQAAGYTIDNVVDGSFSTTESDKQRKYKVFLEDTLERDLSKISAVKSATVELTIPENNGTLIATEEETSAWVLLQLQDELSSERAAAIARSVATAIGNETTDSIVILDGDGNLLFTKDDEYSLTSVANAQLSVKAEAERMVISEVRKVLLGTREFDNVEVATTLVMDFSTTKQTTHK